MWQVRKSPVQLQRLHSDMMSLRYQFLKSQLDLSFTLAAFARSRAANERLKEQCNGTALKGYQRTAEGLSRLALPESEREALRSRLAELREILEHRDVDSPEFIPGFLPNGDDGGACGGSPLQSVKREHLTRREREVLKCIAEGNSTKEVAGKLGITFKTASCHRARIMDKLDIHDLANLVRYAIRQRIIQA